MKLTWCSGIPEIYGQRGEVHLIMVFVLSAICETYVVLCYSRDLWSMGGISDHGICAFCYM